MLLTYSFSGPHHCYGVKPNYPFFAVDALHYLFFLNAGAVIFSIHSI